MLMQLSTLFAAFLAWLDFVVAAPAPLARAETTFTPYSHHDLADDFTLCSLKNQALTNVITKFCSMPRPNAKAEGVVRVMGSDDQKVEDLTWGVQVLWLCGRSPGKGDGEAASDGDINDDVCLSTWWRMCALGDELGGAITIQRGEMGCQEWSE